MKLSKYSKPKVLLTTSAYVEQLANDQTVYPADAFMQCVEYNRWLQQEITIGHFVVCDKDGKLLPLTELTDPSTAEQWTAHVAYNEAQKHVIFEGWELGLNGKPFEEVFFIVKDNLSIKFGHHNSNRLIIRFNGFSETKYIKSLADLAAETQSNPMKLK